jgi:diguanylate cyclase (GGDEF)-like protein
MSLIILAHSFLTMRHFWTSQFFGDGSTSPVSTSGKTAHAADDSFTTGAAPNTRLIRSIIVFGIVLIAAIIAATGFMLLNLRERDLAETEHELKSLTFVLAEQIDRSFLSMELIQNAVIERMKSLGIASPEDFERQMYGRDTYQQLKDQISGLPYVDALVLMDTEGKRINVSRAWPTPFFKLPDQDFILAFKSDPHLTAFVGRPIHNPITGTWVLNIARRFTGSSGEYLGVVLAVMTVRSFEQTFEAIAPTPNSSIALVRRDGMLLARWPRQEAAMEQSFPYRELFADILSKSNQSTIRHNGVFDGEDRLLSAHVLAHYPIVVVASTPVASAIASWKNGVFYIAGTGILLAFVVGGLVFLSAWQVERRLRGQNRQFDAALNNMVQGLVMFDPSARVVVCNQRYIEMYNLSPDAVKPGCTLHKLLEHRKEVGLFIGDPEQRCRIILEAIAREETVVWAQEMTDGRMIQTVDQPMPGGGWVSTHEDVTERKRADAKIAYMAHHDELTGLPNRAHFHDSLNEALSSMQRETRVAVLYLDLDRFKKVNDTLGHPVGDDLLKAVAGRLRSCVKEDATVVRLGGDEFAVIQPAIKQPRNAAVLADHILAAIAAPYEIGGHEIIISTSIGIAIAPDDGTETDQLIKNADMALYGAKAVERGTFRFFAAEMDAGVKVRANMEADLRKALVNGEFELFYQPLINTQRNEVSCCEALLRWHHPQAGMISPVEFIPVAEDMGLIIPLGEWVLRKACADAAKWPNNVSVAVNVSTIQFRKQGLTQTVIAALAASGLPAHRLEIEITETVILEDSNEIRATLHQLHELGVKIVMDDFGTGYSSLSYLRKFPFDKIKIDAFFIRGLSDGSDSSTIVEAITRMATTMKIATVVEGIETQQQLEKVRDWGCTEMQGYLFSRPKPIEEILPMFAPRAERTKSAANAA